MVLLLLRLIDFTEGARDTNPFTLFLAWTERELGDGAQGDSERWKQHNMYIADSSSSEAQSLQGPVFHLPLSSHSFTQALTNSTSSSCTFLMTSGTFPSARPFSSQ